MANSNLREWAVKGAEQRLVELAEEARAIFAAFPELRGRGRGFENMNRRHTGGTRQRWHPTSAIARRSLNRCSTENISSGSEETMEWSGGRSRARATEGEKRGTESPRQPRDRLVAERDPRHQGPGGPSGPGNGRFIQAFTTRIHGIAFGPGLAAFRYDTRPSVSGLVSSRGRWKVAAPALHAPSPADHSNCRGHRKRTMPVCSRSEPLKDSFAR